jgi:hypothetical protein
MVQVAELRKETEMIVCTCIDPECPFNCISSDDEAEKESPDLGFGSMEFTPCKNKEASSRHSVAWNMQLNPTQTLRRKTLAHSTSTSLTNIPKGVQKRSDGTILEGDYPGAYSRGKTRSRPLGSGFSMSHLNRLDVNFSEGQESDCQVDQDGLTSNQDYMFNRKAPERRLLSRNLRRDNRNSPPVGHRKSDGVLSLMRYSSSGEICQRHGSVPEVTRPSCIARLNSLQMKRHTIVA